jgi:hypothetical protein
MTKNRARGIDRLPGISAQEDCRTSDPGNGGISRARPRSRRFHINELNAERKERDSVAQELRTHVADYGC